MATTTEVLDSWRKLKHRHREADRLFMQILMHPKSDVSTEQIMELIAKRREQHASWQRTTRRTLDWLHKKGRFIFDKEFEDELRRP